MIFYSVGWYKFILEAKRQFSFGKNSTLPKFITFEKFSHYYNSTNQTLAMRNTSAGYWVIVYHLRVRVQIEQFSEEKGFILRDTEKEV